MESILGEIMRNLFLQLPGDYVIADVPKPETLKTKN
jgi:hypothetical protein